jgi:hypothetical protein
LFTVIGGKFKFQVILNILFWRFEDFKSTSHFLKKSHLYLFIKMPHCTSVQPKPGFSIKNGNQGPILVSILEFKLFFPNRNFFFSKKFQIEKKNHVFPLEDISSYELENKSKSDNFTLPGFTEIK